MFVRTYWRTCLTVAAALTLSLSFSGLVHADENTAPPVTVEDSDQSALDAPTDSSLALESAVSEPADSDLAPESTDSGPVLESADSGPVLESADLEPTEPVDPEPVSNEISAIESDTASDTVDVPVVDDMESAGPQLWAYLEVTERSGDICTGMRYCLNYVNGRFEDGDTVSYRLSIQNTGTSPVTGIILQGSLNGAGTPPVLECSSSDQVPVDVTDGSANLQPGTRLECSAQYTLVETDPSLASGNEALITYSVTGTALSGADQATPVEITMVSDPDLGPSVTSVSVELGVSLAEDWPIEIGFIEKNGGIPDSSASVPQDQRTQLNLPGIPNTDVRTPESWTKLLEITQPAHGVVETEQTLLTTVYYKPNAGFVGTDSFTYTIEDYTGQQATATVTVTVLAVPVPSGGTVVPPAQAAGISALVLITVGLALLAARRRAFHLG